MSDERQVFREGDSDAVHALLEDWQRNRRGEVAFVDEVRWSPAEGDVEMRVELPHGDEAFSCRLSTPISDTEDTELTPLLRRHSLGYDQVQELTGRAVDVTWDERCGEWRFDALQDTEQLRYAGVRPLLVGGWMGVAVCCIALFGPIVGAVLSAVVGLVLAALPGRNSIQSDNGGNGEKRVDSRGSRYRRREVMSGDFLTRQLPSHGVGDWVDIDLIETDLQRRGQADGLSGRVVAVHDSSDAIEYTVAVENGTQVRVGEKELDEG